MFFFAEKTIFSQEHRGSFTFYMGVQLFPGGGGVQMLISIENHITCDFSGRGVRITYTPSPSGSAHVRNV